MQPVVTEVEAEGDCIWDLVQLHGDYMPKNLNIQTVIKVLRESLVGTWEYLCLGSTTYTLVNPVFTVTSHLIVSLVSQTNAAAVTIITNTSMTTVAKVTTIILKSTAMQVSNKLLTMSLAALLVACSSDEESPLATPALEIPTLQIKSTSTRKTYDYSTQLDMTVEHENTEILDPYETGF